MIALYRSLQQKFLSYLAPSPVTSLTDPFVRLATTHTLSSQRRERHHYDPQTPKDSLDFMIKTVYNPWTFNADKPTIFVQVSNNNILQFYTQNMTQLTLQY